MARAAWHALATGVRCSRYTLCWAAWARGRSTIRSTLTCEGLVTAQATASATSSAVSGSATPGVDGRRLLRVAAEPGQRELVGLDHAGGDLDHPDRLAAELEPQRRGDRVRPVLGRDIPAAALVGGEPGRRAHDHHRAVAAGDQLGQQRLHRCAACRARSTGTWSASRAADASAIWSAPSAPPALATRTSQPVKRGGQRVDLRPGR